MERFMQESDEEDAILTGPTVFSSKKPADLVKGWDKAKKYPPDNETQNAENEACYIIFLKTLKILAYLISFFLTLGGAVLAKSSFLIMTSQLEDKRRVRYCSTRARQLETEIPDLEKISWMWAIFFCFLAPEALVFIRAARIWLLKATTMPNFTQFIVPFFFETCHAFGLSLFAYIVLPSMNVVRGAMLTNALFAVPAIFSIFNRSPAKLSKKPRTSYEAEEPSQKEIEKRKQAEINRKWASLVAIDTLSLLFLLSGLIIWPIFNNEPSGRSYLLPLSAILISCGWWENYADRTSPFGPMRALGNLKLAESRYITYLFIPVWKTAVFMGGMVFSYWLLGGEMGRVFTDFEKAFGVHEILVTEIRPAISNGSIPNITSEQFYGQVLKAESVDTTVLYTILIQILSAFTCYLSAKFACKIGIQSFSFAFPLSLAVPVTLVILVSMCGLYEENTCFWSSFFPPYFFWTCPKGDLLHDFMIKEYGWVWFLWLLSQTWLTLHIWSPKFRRLERAEILFVSPSYSSLLISTSLPLNRRRKDLPIYLGGEEEEGGMGGRSGGGRGYHELSNEVEEEEEDTIPKIIACATMWHEIKDEMMEMLKSIFRMDQDYATRFIYKKVFGVKDTDFYHFETHIFFDDAFTKRGHSVNTYVKDLVNTLEEAACHVHEREVILLPPKKYPTPYGGRLEWVLPGGTQLICHLKNKDKIRHKKRWSQVMYMYYFLGHKLLDSGLSVPRKEVIAENTFLLALDGDIDFKPSAVLLLVDLMKKNKNLGAACGRIHPIGSGMMVWYQKFEYAIGHWFQKATEHVIGCVLCSPGCFSLFRGKALLDDNVMAKYTTEASEPIHYVQYDQGEDRWLCTLLLQQGYRVEYSAASDAYTHSPEVFNEFFTQRRRWVPSTMANIFDLLMDYKRTIRMNPDISYPYVAYQMLMMVGSILGPGSIFLMLIGAFNAAFKIPNWDCFIWNIIPVLLFIIICFFFESDFQLLIAQILSAGYALIMVAVVVALMMQIQEDGIWAPSSLFLFAVAGSFIIAAMLHPQEFWCLPHGLVYYITIPSMYLLLIIYSLMNLHVVSWGTREVVEEVEVLPEKEAQEKAKKELEASKKNGLWGFFSAAQDDKEGSFEVSFAGLFKLMCCTKPVDEKFQLAQIATNLMDINKRLDSMERTSSGSPASSERRFSPVNIDVVGGAEKYENEGTVSSAENVKIVKKVVPEKRNDLINPEWIDDPDLKDGDVDFLSGYELNFWHALIEKYLKPIDKDPKKEEQLGKDLIALRNKMIFFFFMVNAVFVVAIFLLQNQKETIFIEWPFGKTVNMTFIGGTENKIELQVNSLHLEPIGVMFVAVFAVILLIQFVAMLIHRFGTFCHILASTVIEWCSRDVASVAKQSTQDKEGFMEIQKIITAKNDKGVVRRKSRATTGDVARRRTIHNLESRAKETKKKPTNLMTSFEENWQQALTDENRRKTLLGNNANSRVTFQHLVKRRSTLLEHRSSTVENVRRSIVSNAHSSNHSNSNNNNRESDRKGSTAYPRRGTQVEFQNKAFQDDF